MIKVTKNGVDLNIFSVGYNNLNMDIFYENT